MLIKRYKLDCQDQKVFFLLFFITGQYSNCINESSNYYFFAWKIGKINAPVMTL